MRTKLFSWCLPVLCAVIFPQAAQAAMEGGIWHYDDADGVAHFSNIPDGTSPYRLYLKDPGAYRLTVLVCDFEGQFICRVEQQESP